MRRAWLLLLAGCATAPEAPPAATPHPFIRHFPEGLGAPALLSTGGVDGRRLALYRARPAPNPERARSTYLVFYKGLQLGDYPDHSGDPLDGFYELRDAESGRVLLPLDWHKIVVIPGAAVYVLPPDERAQYKSFVDHPSARERCRWSRLNVKTGVLEPSDIRFIEAYPRQDGTSWLIFRQKTLNQPFSADIVSSSGEFLGHYDDVLPAPGKRVVHSLGSFHLLSTRGPDGRRRDHLLGGKLELLEVLPYRVLPVGPFMARQAPGTADVDDLWIILQKNGRFAAPPGAIGVRPLSEEWSPHARKEALEKGLPIPARSWLIRFEDGAPLAWGKADRELKEISKPLWTSAELALPPSSPAHKTKYRSWWERPVLITSDGQGWTAELLDPGYVDSDLKPEDGRARGASAAEAVGRVFGACAAAKANDDARRAARQAQDRAFWEAQRKQKRDLDWRDALAANNADELGRLAWERGGDAWYDYAIRVVAPSPFLLDQAAGRVTSPAKAAELRERAQRRREELAREEAARQAWAAAQEAAARRSAQAYYGSSGAFSGSSLSVPALSAQQLEYRATTSLNKAIYGTSWDPYK